LAISVKHEITFGDVSAVDAELTRFCGEKVRKVAMDATLPQKRPQSIMRRDETGD